MGSRVGERVVVAVDTETTGFGADDRIVSLGAIRIDERRLFSPAPDGEARLDVDILHRHFDPSRKSHHRAQMVHGLSDWALRHCDPIEAHLGEIAAFLSNSDLVVMHNEAFDRRMIDAEFARCGSAFVWPETKCTMETEKARGRSGALATAIAGLGLARSGDTHGALEDAYFCLVLHLVQSGCGNIPSAAPFRGPPSDLVIPPPKPARAPNHNGYGATAALWRSIWPLAIVSRSMVHACGETVACEKIHRSVLAEAATDASPEALAFVVVQTTGWRPSDEEVRLAAARLVRDDHREIFARAASAMIKSDGVVSPGEVEALRRVIAAGRRETA